MFSIGSHKTCLSSVFTRSFPKSAPFKMPYPSADIEWHWLDLVLQQSFASSQEGGQKGKKWAVNGRDSRKPKELDLLYIMHCIETHGIPQRGSLRGGLPFPWNVSLKKMSVCFGRLVKDVVCVLWQLWALSPGVRCADVAHNIWDCI